MLGPLLVGGFVNRPQRCWRAEKPSRLRCRCGAFANAPYDSEAIAGSRKLVASGTPPTVSSCADTVRKRRVSADANPRRQSAMVKLVGGDCRFPKIGGERNASYGFEVVLTPSASGRVSADANPRRQSAMVKLVGGDCRFPKNWWRAERLLRFRGCADTVRKRASFCRCQPSSAIRDGKTGRGRSRTPR